MFRRSRHYVLTAPLECLLIDERHTLSGALVNLSLYGAFVATEPRESAQLDEGAIVCLSMRLDEPREPSLTFALDRGALVWSNTARRRTPDPTLEVRARVAWCNYAPQRRVSDLAEGVGLHFILTERAQRRVTAMIAELHYRNLVRNDASWRSETPESRGHEREVPLAPFIGHTPYTAQNIIPSRLKKARDSHGTGVRSRVVTRTPR